MPIDKQILEAAKIAACRELYLRGYSHKTIEDEMHNLGFRDFSRRILYKRTTGRGQREGWIAEFNWSAGILPARVRAKTGGQDARAPVEGARDPDFIEWLKRVSPNMTWTWRHQQYIYKQLQRVTDGFCKRLMIFMPPRHGKSELVTVRYTAWRMRRKPSMNVILASYGQKLANRFSRSIRRVLCDDALLSEPGAVATGSRDGESTVPGRGDAITNGLTINSPESLSIQASVRPEEPASQAGMLAAPVRNPVATAPGSDRMFPFISQKPVNSVSEWGTAAGGGLRAVGVGSGVTGFGADLIVIDDPVKNRTQAESETYRERVWDWYTDDLYTRLEPNGAIVLIQTRWHEDDLAGRLLKQMDDGGEEWEIVDLPALAEGRNASIPACKAGSSGLTNAATDESTGGLTDNNDRHAGGTGVGKQDACVPVGQDARAPVGDWRRPGDALCPERFDKEKLGQIRSQLGTYSFSALYQQQPTPADGAIFKKKWLKNIVDAAPPGLKWFRGYDLAISTRTTADYTASFRVALDELGFLYIADGFRKRIEYPEQRRYIIERIKTERDTRHGIEDSANAKAVISELRRVSRLSNFSFKTVPVVGDKLTRALNWLPRAEEGKLRLVRGAWIDDFIAELIRFPKGKHDDQIDAVSIAVHMMAEGVDKRLHRF